MNKYIMFIFCSLSLILFSCSNKKKDNEYKEYIISDLTKTLTDTLKFEVIDRPLMFEVIILGEINGATIKFKGSPELKLRGIINDTLKAEWYEPKIEFRYTPTSVVQGNSITLKYRMY
ncbi:hypothetical protein INQ45_14225 [Flavobacterium columnare]|uniref:hypothetical protein n=1 Tax=Flavobacterium columnare TaxID=996 RepID=UPI002D216601|nr:hypothetical protein [Flavobacterium columnare]MEB3802174.1 hypothetical protein [Flavobacterium columnare]